MHIAKEADEIAMRLAEIEKQLEMIHAAIARQMAMPYMSRNRDLCFFLNLERDVFTARLNELKWMLNE
jgi:hypothetical protein